MNHHKAIFYCQMDSLVGYLTLLASDSALHQVFWDNSEGLDRLDHCQKSSTHTVLKRAKKQLQEYFEGKRQSFDLPIAAKGTAFQQQAWAELSKIPYGETISYAEQAARLGNKNKARAVGLANGANPLSIIVPCHRVIGSNGKLTGFGGGLSKKAILLNLEKTSLHDKTLT